MGLLGNEFRMIPNDYDLYLENQKRAKQFSDIMNTIHNGRVDEIEHFVLEFVESYTKDPDIREVIQAMLERLNNA